MSKPPRTQTGYRVFLEDTAGVRFIKRARELGFSLKEIKELLALRIEPGKTRADVRDRAESKLSDIDEKIESFRKMRKSPAKLTKVCSGAGLASDCPILENLNHEE